MTNITRHIVTVSAFPWVMFFIVHFSSCAHSSSLLCSTFWRSRCRMGKCGTLRKLRTVFPSWLKIKSYGVNRCTWMWEQGAFISETYRVRWGQAHLSGLWRDLNVLSCKIPHIFASTMTIISICPCRTSWRATPSDPSSAVKLLTQKNTSHPSLC